MDFTYTHTRLLVSIYAECFRFYRDVLGFDVTWGDVDSGYADFDSGETTLALFDQEAMVSVVGGTGGCDETRVALIFAVGSVDETYERLRDDVEFVTEPHDRPAWGIRVAHCRDPAGNVIEVNRELEA